MTTATSTTIDWPAS